jgi:ribosomal protein L11 methyltransferase
MSDGGVDFTPVSQRFLELAFTVAAADADDTAARLCEAGAAGVEERDQATLARAPEGCAVLVVWIAPDDAAEFLARAAAAGVPTDAVAERLRDDDEWRDAWKRHFAPRAVGRFVIVPSWERYAAAPGEWVLDLDPGRAFGTGGHASTRLCLRQIAAAAERAVARFLDVGCGSGVLAIACARAWPAARGIAIDVDADALEVSRENAARNHVGDRIALAATLPGGAFDLVTANIEPEVLIPMAPALAARLAPAGRLILSGILVEAADEVAAAYRAAGLAQICEETEDGWRALVMGHP